ncbi:MAG: Sec-dependent nitrous-oxide reductase [Dissulfurispiraceae bacterium]|nr:Sec-dependent nitrous-oxide reductase [Dissulfurispiraceae bacterium]
MEALKKVSKWWYLIIIVFVITAFAVPAITQTKSQSLQAVMKERGLNEKDILAAAKTYTPTGKYDPYIALSSGGQSGQVLIYGVPSMRLLKVIGVFTPEPWQGYGYDSESKEILEGGKVNGKQINWGDSHHPNFSETNGDYDGEYAFINDKAHARVAVLDLKDFTTRQIVKNPIMKSDHGGTFVTPNTEYVIETTQYAAPFENKYYPLSEYKTKYRGANTYWKFDRKKGKIDEKLSFSIELPPYMQDLSDAGKGMSFGWSFTNSFNAEMYTGGIEVGNAPFEAGMSAMDTDYLHVVNWKGLEKEVAAGNYKVINGHKVVTMATAIEKGLLYLIPEPKSPHGVDVDPSGQYIIVCGKLDTHASVYDFNKIKALIDKKEFVGKDPFGIPILDMKKALHGQVQLGLGPLHTMLDSRDGVVYTSLYVDSAIVKWDYKKLKTLDKIQVHYNVGHLVTPHGDTIKPHGKYLISLNKLAVDRFNPIGPLHPQNHQLIDISGDKMEMIYDLPIPIGEPHNVGIIDAKLLKPLVRYKLGTDYRTHEKSPYATLPGKERIVRKGNVVEVFGTAIRSHFNPERIEVKKGNKVIIHITNLERAQDETHGFGIYGVDRHISLEPGKTATIEFIADREGVFPYYCTEFCSALHLEMMGYLLVKP